MTNGRLPAPTHRLTSDPPGRKELEIRSLQLQTLQWEFNRSHLHEQTWSQPGSSQSKGQSSSPGGRQVRQLPSTVATSTPIT